MTTNKPASEMPDEVTVSRIRWEDGYILTLMDYGDCPDPVRQTARYVRADKPDAAAAREMLDTMPNLFGDITQRPQPELAKWYDRNFQTIKRILQREAGGVMFNRELNKRLREAETIIDCYETMLNYSHLSENRGGACEYARREIREYRAKWQQTEKWNAG